MYCERIASHLVSFPFYFMGLSNGWLSVYLPQLQTGNPFNISKSDKAWLIASMNMGLILGSVLTACLAKVGRKQKMLALTICYILGSLFLSFPKSTLILCIGRFIIGIGDGCAFIIIPLYTGEVINHKIRGAIGLLWYIMLNLGYFTANAIGKYLNMAQFGYTCILVSLVCFLLIYCTAESPYFLIHTNKTDRAVTALRKISGQSNVVEEINFIERAQQNEKANSETYSQILRKNSNRKILFLVILTLNGKFSSGSYALDAFTQSIYSTLFDILSPLSGTTIYFITKLLSTVLNMILIEKVGRKITLISALVISCFTLLIIAIYLHLKVNNIIEISQVLQYIVLVIVIMTTVSLSVLSSVPQVIISELLPMNMKSFGSLIWGLYGATMIFAQEELFQIIVDYSEMSLPFLILSMLCFLHIFLAYFYMFETKGKTLQTIQEELNRPK